MLHCEICGKALETKITNPITGKESIVGCICDCQKRAIAREKELRVLQDTQRQIKRLQGQSLMGERYCNVTFDTTLTGFNQTFDEAFERCKKYCEVSKQVYENGYGIYIYGDKGTGKTHLTACMANELIKQFRPVMFTNFFEIGEMIKTTFRGKGDTEGNIINRIATVDFLFLDDLGTEKVMQNGEDNWMQGKIFEVLNKRYNNKKPTIFTSNYSIQQLTPERGMMDKTVDRIGEMSTVTLKIEGASNRTKMRSKNLPF